MMFGLGSFNLINKFKRASNEPNAEQLTSSSARLQPYQHLLVENGSNTLGSHFKMDQINLIYFYLGLFFVSPN